MKGNITRLFYSMILSADTYCRKVRRNEENSLDFVCFALVTVLSRPLAAFRGRTLPPQTPVFAPVCGCGAISANTLKSEQTGFFRGKRSFSGAVFQDRSVLIQTKRFAEQRERFCGFPQKRSFQSSGAFAERLCRNLRTRSGRFAAESS